MSYLYSVKNCIQINGFYSMFECRREPGYAFRGETHDFWECVYVKSGKICVTADDRVYNMKKGEIIFHKPMELHKYHVEGNEASDLFIFSYSSEGNLNDYFKNKVFELNYDQMQILENMFEFLNTLDFNLPEIYTCALLEVLKQTPVYMQTVSTYIYSLFLSIYGSNQVSTEIDSESAILLKKAVNFMKSNVHTALKISDIAEHCCISATGLKNIFLQYSGLGVHKYFLKLKISLATRLLEKGASVNETAERLGFSGQAYFSAAYKRETGISPSEAHKTINRKQQQA